MQTKKSFFNLDMLILVIISIGCIYMFCASIPLQGESKIFPQLVSAVTFIFCIYAIGKNVMKAKAEAAASAAAPETDTAAPVAGPKKINHLLLVVIAFLYVALMEPVGFIITTIALFIALPAVLGNRKWKVLIPVAVISTIVFYLIFQKGFYVNLPAGILPFV